MYIAPYARAASAYRKVSVETNVDGASPHQLISLLFSGLRHSLAQAEAAVRSGDIAAKGTQIGRAVRFLEEGLKGGLDATQGGELADRLGALYDYCVSRLTIANLRNDATAVAEVAALIAPVAQAWQDIGQTAAAKAPAVPAALLAA
ncbi:flagellar export chaperone FliS [Xenophilus aerolatus]|nr:flagellar export chaperone FliS [Xenophilus aerolatus]